jgi:hypothetical protein
MAPRPPAALSLDLDNKWSYMKTHGDVGWDSFPSYVDVVVPRVLEFLRQRQLTITFFLVGQDAALAKNRESLAAISQAGHDIGNHSFLHEPWLHLYSEAQIESELARAEEAIEAATGRRPIGFRGPGFSLSEATLRVLKRRGYAYDASTLPTYLGPLARAYYFMTSRFSAAERQQRQALFGHVSDGLRPLKPYLFSFDGGQLLEVPVTTMPGLKLPIHVSYVLYLAQFSRRLALAYFKAGLRVCRASRTPPSLLLHPLDFLGCDDDRDLAFFPAMNLPSAVKLEVVSECLEAYAREFDVLSLDRFSRDRLAGPSMRIEPARFRHPAAPPAEGERAA